MPQPSTEDRSELRTMDAGVWAIPPLWGLVVYGWIDPLGQTVVPIIPILSLTALLTGLVGFMLARPKMGPAAAITVFLFAWLAMLTRMGLPPDEAGWVWGLLAMGITASALLGWVGAVARLRFMPPSPRGPAA